MEVEVGREEETVFLVFPSPQFPLLVIISGVMLEISTFYLMIVVTNIADPGKLYILFNLIMISIQ
jgi:hypothetical protein